MHLLSIIIFDYLNKKIDDLDKTKITTNGNKITTNTNDIATNTNDIANINKNLTAIVRFNVDIIELTAICNRCNFDNVNSDACNHAVHSYCQGKQYITGFNIVEWYNPSVGFFCIK